jgi:hypothetical protein
MQNFTFKLNLYVEKHKGQTVIEVELHQLELFTGVNWVKILFRGQTNIVNCWEE